MSQAHQQYVLARFSSSINSLLCVLFDINQNHNRIFFFFYLILKFICRKKFIRIIKKFFKKYREKSLNKFVLPHIKIYCMFKSDCVRSYWQVDKYIVCTKQISTIDPWISQEIQLNLRNYFKPVRKWCFPVSCPFENEKVKIGLNISSETDISFHME